MITSTCIMETETLSNYNQTQNKHVLDESMDVNIAANEEEVDLSQTNKVTETHFVGIENRDSDDSETVKESRCVESSDYKRNDNKDFEQTVNNSDNDQSDSEIKTNGGELSSKEEDEQSNEEDGTSKSGIENENSEKSEHETEDCDLNSPASNSNENDPLNTEENDSLHREETDPLQSEEYESLNTHENDGLNSEEKDPLNNDDNKEDENPAVDADGESAGEKNQEPHYTAEKDPLNNEHTDEESLSNQKENDEIENIEKEPQPVNEAAVNDPHDTGDNTDVERHSNFKEKQDENAIDEESKNSESNDKSETNEIPPIDAKDSEKMEQTESPNKEEKNNKNETLKEKESKEVEKLDDGPQKCPLLMESLTKSKKDERGQEKPMDEEGDEDMDMDYDLDPSLLCPEVAMEVDEAPVITTTDAEVPNDGSKSPLLYEPVFSTYVDEMTGAEVTFNLSPEEQQLRRTTYGESNPVQYTKIHCTACNVHLGSALEGQSNRFVHPLLKVLICKDCYHFYTSGEFEKDEDGSELYCRWCGQGGQVMCCGNCEMVFCKKCIRINFGRKKLTEIRDSDDWMCFRCNPSQLLNLRVHCAEFMEYVRREIGRAATLENATTFMTTDYTQCCVSQKKKHTDPQVSTEQPKKKKRKTSTDPDYDPFRDQESPGPGPTGIRVIHPTPSSATPTTQAPQTNPQKPVTILPKPGETNKGGPVTTQASQNDQMFRVGNTTFRPRTFVPQSRPRVQIFNPVAGPSGVRTTVPSPGYIKILPGGIRVHPNTPRSQLAQTYTSASNVRPQQQVQRQVRPPNNATHQMKHEWFEKTVRAAARVNSNLSYTLTQLNRAQATATSVEGLAVVHNKLQEILSTSINSLIQIRKNLRTEFIAGIKNIRFPPTAKPPVPPTQPSSSAQDDDVIFVSPTPSPVPPLVTSSSSSKNLPPGVLNLPPSVSLTSISKTPSQTSSTPRATFPNPGSSKENGRPTTFLRVKSLTALQNVTSECITIPDDPPPPPLAPIKNNDVTKIGENPEKKDEAEPVIDKGIAIKGVTTLDDGKDDNNKENEKAKVVENGITNGHNAKKNETKEIIKTLDQLTFNINDKSSPEMKKILSTKVYLNRSEVIDNLVKKTFGHLNGESGDIAN